MHCERVNTLQQAKRCKHRNDAKKKKTHKTNTVLKDEQDEKIKVNFCRGKQKVRYVFVVVVCFNIWLQTLIYETCISD